MLKKTITYEDFNGNQQTEDLYFNLTSSELVDMEMEYPGGWGEHLKNLTVAKDGKEIMRVFKDLISKTYGVRSEDGRHFVKKPELSAEFLQSASYDALFMDLATNEKAAIDFVNGLLPQKIQQQISVAPSPETDVIFKGYQNPYPAVGTSPLTQEQIDGVTTSPLTQEELVGMSSAEFTYFKELQSDEERSKWIRSFRLSRKQS